MFETVVPERVHPRSRKLFYEMLPISVGIHALAAASVMASSLWTVIFPEHSPRMYAAYQIIATTPPPPPPPAPPTVRRTPVNPQARAVPVKMPLVAPTIIPDFIPEVVEEVPYVEEPQIPVAVDTIGGGVEGGIAGGELGGEVGGVQGGLPQMPEPEIIEVKRDAPLPMGAISQEYPGYPEYALKRMWEDTLVVRYTIGKNGRVTDVEILTPPEREEFAREAVAKIKHWRFHPYIGENGEAKEVTHELTVEFRIVRKGKR